MWDGGDLARPDLPVPSCRVKLICGPPAVGKTTYVLRNFTPGDIIIDLDLIAKELGIDRAATSELIAELLEERNHRLAQLANEPRNRVAWVVLTAPSRSLRSWWCQALGVIRHVLTAPRDELVRRILTDPDRAVVRQRQIQAVDRWFRYERDNNPGVLKPGYDAYGHPTDPLHPWNR
jgi:hypothetical protein